MSTIQIQSRKKPADELSGFWDQGFRPFFFGAIIFSFLSILHWTLIYASLIEPPVSKTCLTEWHAHQMIFGYTFAVIAGFLLTAVPNWTNTQSNGGIRLKVVFSLWVISRFLFLAGDRFLIFAAFTDIAFGLFLFYLIASPIIRKKNWGQSGILAKLIILITSNVYYYLSYLGVIESVSRAAIYSAFFIIIGLILTISGRVFANFARIATSIDYIKPEPKIQRMLALFVFLLFYINEVFIHAETFSSVVCILLFVIYGKRLFAWYHTKIWAKPLIWSIYLSVFFINLSFLLIALNLVYPVPKLFAVHTMAIGGIGLATAGFMVRVCLGHSGKNIHFPPPQTTFVLIVLLLSLFFRVAMPMINMAEYANWILVSQTLWILAFFSLLFLCFAKEKTKT